MRQPDDIHPVQDSGDRLPDDALPPVIEPPELPPPLPPVARRGWNPWVVVAISVGGVVAALVLGLTAVGLLTAAKVKERKIARANVVAEVRQRQSARAVVSAARAAGSDSGVSHTNITFPDVPWSIHVLKIDRSREDLMLCSAHAGERVLGVSLIADQARAVPREIGTAIGAVNGDFYVRDDPTYAGDPRGLQIIHGELISAPDTVSVWFDAEGSPHLGEVKSDFNVTWPDGRKTRFGLNEQRRPGMAVLYTPTYGTTTRVRGGRDLILEKDGDGPWLPLKAGETYRARVREVRTDGNTPIKDDTLVLSLAPDLVASAASATRGGVVTIATPTTPSLQGVQSAIGGGPALINDGRKFSQRTPPAGTSGDWSQRSKYERHPRSAVGWSPTHFYLVTVDGRQPGLSEGMKLAELADFMAGLGCIEAMNLDGGKSAQMWLNGYIVNSPCQGEDTVANSLLVVRKAGDRVK